MVLARWRTQIRFYFNLNSSDTGFECVRHIEKSLFNQFFKVRHFNCWWYRDSDLGWSCEGCKAKYRSDSEFRKSKCTLWLYFYIQVRKPENHKRLTKVIFSTTSGSTGKPKILEFENKWMGEFPVYTKDVQGPGDIFKLCGKFGCSRTMKIAKGKNNLGMFLKKEPTD